MRYFSGCSKRRELFESHWGTFYWWVIAAAFGVALVIQYPWEHKGDLFVDLTFGTWTFAMYLLSRRFPFESRLIHALGVLPIIGFYVTLPDISIPPEYRLQFYVLLSFFPVYAAAAMVGVWGFALALLLATVSGLSVLEDPPLVSIAIFFWLLSGFLGLGYHRMVEKLKKFHRELLTQALTDPLTGLRNRRALEEDFPRLQALAQREGKPLIFTLWDVNNLKRVNDLHGHAAGDRVLKRFAQALKDAVRQSDALYRIGGDEFAGLHIALEDPPALFERVHESFPWTSYGWVDATHLTLDDAYRLADRKLYHSKAQKEDKVPELTTED